MKSGIFVYLVSRFVTFNEIVCASFGVLCLLAQIFGSVLEWKIHYTSLIRKNFEGN